tara:strand:- start:367 stop:555 length:189 start_codon:yes stop_codon:yes gene_type:complete
MTDPYARPTGRIARVVDSTRYVVGVAIVGGVACVGTVALGVCVSGALLALAVSPRAARTMLW